MSDITINAPITLPAAVEITAPITIGYAGPAGAAGTNGADGADGADAPDTLAGLSDVTSYDLATLNTPVADALAGKSSTSHTHTNAEVNTSIAADPSATRTAAGLGTIATFEGDQPLRTTDPATFAAITGTTGTFSGNVGIGGVTPTSTLHIAGTLQLNTSVSNAFKVFLGGYYGLVIDHDSVQTSVSNRSLTLTGGTFLDLTTWGGIAAVRLQGGEVILSGEVSASGTVKTGAYTVDTLPTPSTGMCAYVTDSNRSANGHFGSAIIAARGGTEYIVPVFYDGTDWIIA